MRATLTFNGLKKKFCKEKVNPIYSYFQHIKRWERSIHKRGSYFPLSYGDVLQGALLYPQLYIVI